jgi:ATP-dependent RNA helicase RhlE
MGFINDVKRVIAKLPAVRQTLFFSATMPPEIQKLADVLLTNPAKVEVSPPSSTVDKIDQTIYFTNKNDKPKLLHHLLKAEKIETALVFTRTKHGADKVVKFLHSVDITAAAIHGNKSQNARQNALNNFKQGKLSVLVATDIAARGIDIDELTHVFNFDLPEVPETYVHRIGRTGRAGNAGTAIAFCDAEERPELRDIEKVISKIIPVVHDHPYPMVGGFSTAPKPAQRQQQRRPQGNGHNRPNTQGAKPQGNRPNRQPRNVGA